MSSKGKGDYADQRSCFEQETMVDDAVNLCFKLYRDGDKNYRSVYHAVADAVEMILDNRRKTGGTDAAGASRSLLEQKVKDQLRSDPNVGYIGHLK